jgi:hypothetical protein
MKKIINISLMAFTLAFIGTLDAKIMKRKTGPIPVTKNEKQIFVDTKELKNAPTPQEKIASAQKLAADLQKDPYSQLKTEEMMIKKEIKEKEEEIQGLEDAELIEQAVMEKEDLKEQLAIIQGKLGKYDAIQPQAVSRLKNWALYTLILTVGLGIADQLILGGVGRTALMSGASAAGSAIGSAASTAWGYVPSWRSTPLPKTVSNVGPAVTTATTSAALTWGQTASNVIASAKDLLLSGAMTGAASYVGNKVYIMLMDLEKAEKDPSVTPEELKEKIVELQELLDEFNAQNSKK